MSNVWLKFRIWTKIISFTFLLLYSIVFNAKNSDRPVKPWLWPYTDTDTTVLALAVSACLLGIIGTILVRTTLRTLRQIKELRARTQAEKLERQVADMQNKAARLRPRGEVIGGPGAGNI